MNHEPLGTLLVRRELITAEELAAALAEQKASGEPLGQIVVARGYASPANIAQALATQHGGLLKTEYGFATGFGSGEEPSAVAAPPLTLTPSKAAKTGLRTAVAARVEESHVEVEVEAEADREAVRAEVASASAEAEKLNDENGRLAALRAELEQRLASESQRAASLERDLAARDATIEDFKRVADSWQRGLAERDEAIAALLVARDDALRRLEAARLDPWASAERHLLFFLGAEGYELVERDGPPPAVGAHVQLESGVQVVAHVATAPGSSSGLPCVYLAAV